MIPSNRRLPLLVAAGWLLAMPPSALATEITQFFPVAPDGSSAQKPESGWRIRYEILEAGTHNYGGSAVWEFESIEFMRGYDASGAEDWVKILNNLVLAEMYVPYNNGTEIFDISGFGFGFVTAVPGYIAPGSLDAKVLDDSVVIAEVIDEHLRWMDTDDTSGAARRWICGRRSTPRTTAMS